MSALPTEMIAANDAGLVSWRHCEMHTRSTFTILSLCLSTLVICVWNAVHHGVPFPGTPRWKVYLTRFYGFLIGLFLPEVLVLNAIEEFILARKLLKLMRRAWSDGAQPGPARSPFTLSYWTEAWRPSFVATEPERPQWTMSHAFYAVMGGFVAKSQTGRVTVVSPSEIESMCLYSSNIRLLFAAENINDHSKAGAFAKAVFCWQLVVFAVNCVARRAEHLPLSLLEITTLAHSLCGLVAFALWWDKPHSVDEAIVVSANANASVMDHIFWSKLDPSDHLPLLGMAMFLQDRNTAKPVLCSLAVAALYGLPHLLALSTDFPTSAERLCWQISTAIITGTPLSMVVLGRLAASLRSRIILITVFIAYPMASCFIIVESIRQLFALPRAAFISLSLVCYLPHFS